MDVLDIARWQFGIITVYHFLFVPLTIGLTAIVAGWRRRGCGPTSLSTSGSPSSSASCS